MYIPATQKFLESTWGSANSKNTNKSSNCSGTNTSGDLYDYVYSCNSKNANASNDPDGRLFVYMLTEHHSASVGSHIKLNKGTKLMRYLEDNRSNIKVPKVYNKPIHRLKIWELTQYAYAQVDGKHLISKLKSIEGSDLDPINKLICLALVVPYQRIKNAPVNSNVLNIRLNKLAKTIKTREQLNHLYSSDEGKAWMFQLLSNPAV